MIDLKHLRDLRLQAPSASGRAAHLSAASGLVTLQHRLCVIADDEHHLGLFPRESAEPGVLLRILPGDLPAKPGARKKKKKDFEALVRLPSFTGYPAGALCALGSGSKDHRYTAVLLALNAAQELARDASAVDLAPWYERLADEIDGLNIEGAVVVGSRLRLFQRGNKGAGVNAVIDLELAPFLSALASDAEPLMDVPLTITRCELGDIDGVPYGFTDAAALPDGRVLFSAVAEDTSDPVQDGACVGAAIGLLDAHARVMCMECLRTPWKIEGIAITGKDDGISFFAVTDADDAEIPAALLSGVLRK